MTWTTALPLLTLAVLAPGAEQKAPPRPGQFPGKVVALAALLKDQGVHLDADAAPTSLALQTDDGKLYPLLKNDGSRLFFKDRTLLGRPVRLTGRLVAGSSLLEVTEVHTVVKGKVHEVYYWCESCALAYSEPGACICCGAPVKLREVEVEGASGEKVQKLLPHEN